MNPGLGFLATIYSANFFTLFLTIFIPLSSDAFNSKTLYLQKSFPKSYLANAIIAEVFPVPGGPWRSKCGKFPVFNTPYKLCTTSS
jgi:hypothetical protein